MNTIFVAMVGPIATYFLSILGLVVVAGYATFRLNSTQIIREKVWGSFVGDKDFNDERLKSFARDQLDLARFRVVYGVPARSVRDLHRLLSWMERYKIGPIDVKRIRGWIDPSRDEPLKAPGRRYVLVCVVMLGILIFSFTSSGRAASSEATWFRMNVSKTWFSSDGTSVNAVWGHWRIDSESCVKHTLPDVKVTGLTSAETTSICNAIASGELKAKVRDSLRAQRWGLGVVSLIIVLLVACLILHLYSALLARQMGRQLCSGEKISGEYQSQLQEVAGLLEQ